MRSGSPTLGRFAATSRRSIDTRAVLELHKPRIAGGIEGSLCRLRRHRGSTTLPVEQDVERALKISDRTCIMDKA